VSLTHRYGGEVVSGLGRESWEGEERVVKSQVSLAYACNSSYSGGRDQEDRNLKPAWANSLQDPISKKITKKRAGGVGQGVGPEFKSALLTLPTPPPPKRKGSSVPAQVEVHLQCWNPDIAGCWCSRNSFPLGAATLLSHLCLQLVFPSPSERLSLGI
jgi:hypothetical protein